MSEASNPNDSSSAAAREIPSKKPTEHASDQESETIFLDSGEATNDERDGTIPRADDSSVPSGLRATPKRLPDRLGRYRIERKLGQGAMGAIFLAHDTQLDRQIALKVPFFDEDDGPDVIDRFYREARAMATLQHPNICPVFDVGEIGGVHYLTMAFIDGHPLSDYLKKKKPNPSRQVAILVRKLALGLQSAHDSGIVHRDLKPSNVMIKKDQEPVIMDFGLARRRKEGEASLTQTGTLLGTPAYMAPEQVRGKQELIGPQSDVYALGVICYQLLTGRVPFNGSLGEVMAAVLTEEPVLPSEVNEADVNRSIEAICLKAMAKNLDQRYTSAAELAKALRDYIQGERIKGEGGRPKGKSPQANRFLDKDCPKCGKPLRIPAERERAAVQCPECGYWGFVF